MTMQTRTAQRRIVEAAQRDGSLDDLRWYVVGRRRLTDYAVAAPGAWIPTVAVAPDPAIAEQWAQMLLELVRAGNPGLEIRLELTTTALLAGHAWYEFEDSAEWDAVCPACGAVAPRAAGPLCGTCGAGPSLGRWLSECSTSIGSMSTAC